MPADETFKDLIHRLDGFVGVPFEELGEFFERPWTEKARKNKGWPGLIVHDILQEGPANAPEPDVPRFGIEVKSIPVGQNARVLEPTKVGTLNYDVVASTPWWSSNTFHKLRSVLFVPVVKLDSNKPNEFFIRTPFLWLPSRADLTRFEEDYESVRTLIRSGKFDEISSARPPKGQGVALHPKPNAADGSKRTKATKGNARVPVVPRAWMLRTTFTNPIVHYGLKLKARAGELGGG